MLVIIVNFRFTLQNYQFFQHPTNFLDGKNFTRFHKKQIEKRKIDGIGDFYSIEVW